MPTVATHLPIQVVNRKYFKFRDSYFASLVQGRIRIRINIYFKPDLCYRRTLTSSNLSCKSEASYVVPRRSFES
jgi:hypothetical protein